MSSPKQKWIVEETWAEVIERFDSLCLTREEAIAAWEECYGRPFQDKFYHTVKMVSGDTVLEPYWGNGKHYSGFYDYSANWLSGW